MATIKLLVAIYDDGLGTFQARCMSCPWRGTWRRKEGRAVEDAQGHTHEDVEA